MGGRALELRKKFNHGFPEGLQLFQLATELGVLFALLPVKAVDIHHLTNVGADAIVQLLLSLPHLPGEALLPFVKFHTYDRFTDQSLQEDLVLVRQGVALLLLQVCHLRAALFMHSCSSARRGSRQRGPLASDTRSVFFLITSSSDILRCPAITIRPAFSPSPCSEASLEGQLGTAR